MEYSTTLAVTWAANYSPVKICPVSGWAIHLRPVTADSSLVAHDSLNMGIHRLIDISDGIPTLA